MTVARRWMAAALVLSLAAIGAAVATQVGWDMRPCPWCVLQRLIFAACAVAALVGLALPRFGSALLTPLALSGIAAALWQHFVAASSSSCALTLADRIMGASGLDARFPDVFMAQTSCADAAVDLFGLPYEWWSLALFVALLAIGVMALRRRR